MKNKFFYNKKWPIFFLILPIASAIGNMELKNKFEIGADKIRRGVVFAASLYV